MSTESQSSSAGKPHSRNSIMRAARVHQFGPPDVITIEAVARPIPQHGEVLVKIYAAGVGPWDAWIRSGHSALPQPLPLTLGSDFAGTIEVVGPDVIDYSPGDKVYGVTNPQFTGAYADFAIASVDMIASHPVSLSYVQAASVPVVATTAWQMLFDKGKLTANQNVLILGGAGNVGEYAVRLASLHGANVWTTVLGADSQGMTDLGTTHVIDVQNISLPELPKHFDVVIDTVGGEAQRQAISLLKPGGVLVSAVAQPDQTLASRALVTALFFLVQVNRNTLQILGNMFDTQQLKTHIGTVLPFGDARLAHEMLEGLRAHASGKIVLDLVGNAGISATESICTPESN